MYICFVLQEIAAILISFARHPEWLSKEVKIRYCHIITHTFPPHPSSLI